MMIAGLVALVIIASVAWMSIPTLSTPPDATEVVQRLENEGLPIGGVETYNAENDPNELLGRPGQYTSKANFKDTRLESEPFSEGFNIRNGGSVEVFETEEEAKRREEYLRTISEATSMFAEYSYRDDRVLLRLSRRLTPEKAEEYETALQEVL